MGDGWQGSEDQAPSERLADVICSWPLLTAADVDDIIERAPAFMGTPVDRERVLALLAKRGWVAAREEFSTTTLDACLHSVESRVANFSRVQDNPGTRPIAE